MIVDCPSCDQSYELADEQVTGKSVILSCPPCNTSWIVGPYESQDALEDSTDAEPTRPLQQEAANMFKSSQLPPAPHSSIPAPPSAMRVPRGGERERRDMFASQVPLEFRQQEERPSSRPSSSPGGTGERNEHSVLFTVDALRRSSTMMPPPMAAPASFVNGRRVDTAAAPAYPLYASTPSSAPAPQAATDEAGVIDLKPMLSEGGSIKPRSAPLFSPASDFAPFGFTVSVPPQKNTPIAMIAGIAAAAVILLGVTLGLALHGSSSASTDQAELAAPPPRMAAASLQQVTAPATTQSITPSADVKVDAKSDAKVDDTVATSPMKSTYAGPRAKGAGKWTKSANTARVQSSGTGTFTAKASAPPAPPKAKGGAGKKSAADPCGCGGNLQCAMKCGL